MAAGVLVLLGIAFAFAVSALVALTRDDPAFRASTRTLPDWLDGRVVHRIDRAIDVPYGPWLHRWQAAIRYRLLGDLGPQVREGCPGWLFYADGLRPPPATAGIIPAEATMAAHVATLHTYADALRRMGVTLVVVTVPDKSRIETQALCGLRQDPRMTQRLQTWRRALDQAGVLHVDLVAALSAARPAYYRTDVHWNARGAQAAAQAIGDAISPLLGGFGTTRFVTTREPGVHERVGDLLTLAGLEHVPDPWRPAPDRMVPETIRAVASGGLLDDGPAAAVLLAGDSFARRSAFAGRLGAVLGREVWNTSVDDGRFDRALAATWAQRASWPKTLRVVLWELSEDALSMPQDDASVATHDASAVVP